MRCRTAPSRCGHSAPYYYVGKDPTFAFGTALPFGMNARHAERVDVSTAAGCELINDFCSDYNIVFVPAGNTGAQMGGWFRKEIKTRGRPQGPQVPHRRLRRPGPDASSAWCRSRSPAATSIRRWRRARSTPPNGSGPYDDEKLGFVKVAKYYYYPGWWEGCTQSGFFISLKEWEKLPPSYRTAINAVASEVMNWSLAKYDSGNPAALRRLVAAGAELRPFPRDMMAACYDIAFDQYEELAAKNPKFKKIYDSWKPFRDEQYLWSRVAENTFDNFVYAQQAAKKR